MAERVVNFPGEHAFEDGVFSGGNCVTSGHWWLTVTVTRRTRALGK